ncbi:unnamed protein product [Medioppia subpectinata]|uniref:Spaetzle domain-containing protein n=1 Tax=Medioppia subpectinata TaxID=1979941 RepID=A0A7R9PW14_9ACAR|nr:unnamed protein product [Medioppia subpectinata]CAG2103442.1 unnamed protein product [Medioppia subpectinata]
MTFRLTVNQMDYRLLVLMWIHIEYCLCQMTCGPRMSPRLMREIPCDMSKNSFCAQPGSAYPWSSVRRYIFENQGFMRRMYGDQRQSQILRAELEETREKYDSIYFYGRGRAQNQYIGFGPRSATDSNHSTQTTSSATTLSSFNSSIHLTPNAMNQSLENMTTANESEHKPSLDTEFIDIETETEDSTRFETNPPTTTSDTNHEPNDIPIAEMYISSATPQTTTTSDTKSDPNDSEPKKGVNACPIKEEVVAPYWANNTRGETLALLNVYPFEQYIHWEKCAYEGSQMFCRDGCKCEQQYRLHRLLAFDPKNECRGIFADWFRFPGCCVCICYDLPESLRVNRRKARL